MTPEKKKKNLEEELAKTRKQLKTLSAKRSEAMRKHGAKAGKKMGKKQDKLLDKITKLEKQIHDLGLVHPLRF
jgi:flagellar biosynthesis chaperone FliJ